MTIHISYRHQCEGCQTEYIPYNEAVPCPKCGLVEEERYDLIPRAAYSALYNLEKVESYIPLAWGIFTLGDQILSFIFRLLEQDRLNPGELPFSDRARDFFYKSVDWGEHPYLRDYFYEIAVKVYDQVQKVQ